MTSAPAKLRETGPARTLRRHINMLWDYVRECRPIPGPNVRVSRTGVGAVISAVGGGRNEPVEDGSEINQYIVKTVGEDWLKCRTISNNSEGSEDIYVAKPFELRKTIWDGQTVAYTVEDYGTTLTTRTVNVTYSYKSPVYRIASIALTAESEHQVVIPRYVENRTVIYAVKVSEVIRMTNPSGWNVDLLDLNVGARAWAKAA